MKKGTRNKIILWSTISAVIVLFALLVFIDSKTSTETPSTAVKPVETITETSTETPSTAVKPVETITETSRQKPTAKATNKLSHQSIVYSARHVIRQCLLSPSYNSFPVWPDNSYGVTTLENNTYLVSGKVTSKNIYGVKLQNTWITKLEFNGNNFEIVRATYVKIGDEVFLDVP